MFYIFYDLAAMIIGCILIGSAITSLYFALTVSWGNIVLTFLSCSNLPSVSFWDSKELFLSLYRRESVRSLVSSTFLIAGLADSSVILGVCELRRIYYILSISACLFIDYCRLMPFIFYRWIEAVFRFFSDLWEPMACRLMIFFCEAARLSLFSKCNPYKLPISLCVSQKILYSPA